MTFPLTGKQRRFLRGLGHALKPVVQVGHAGLTEPVLKAIDKALETHELIKIKVAAEAGDGADALVDPLERTPRTAVAQVVGKTLLVYRGRKKEPSIVLPDEHQPGGVNPPVKAEKPRPGNHLAKKKAAKRGSNVNRAQSTARKDKNRHEEGNRQENRSRRAASLRRVEPAGRGEFAGRAAPTERGESSGRPASLRRGPAPRRPKRAE